MSANQAVFRIATMARVLGVSRAGFYAWRHRRPCPHAVADTALLRRVRTVHASSRQTYGAPGFTRTCVTGANGMAANGLRG